MKNDKYLISYFNEILEELIRHELYTFVDGYMDYHQVIFTPKNQFKVTFRTPWIIYCCIVMHLDCTMLLECLKDL
jgi:hypothetical protein